MQQKGIGRDVRLFGLMVGLLVVCLPSCRSIGGSEVADGRFDPIAIRSSLEYEDQAVQAKISFTSRTRNTKLFQVEFRNKTENVLTIVTDLSSFSSAGGAQHKLVVGETREVDSNRTQPSIPIPAKGLVVKDFYFTTGSLPDNLDRGSFIFQYSEGKENRFITFLGTSSTSRVQQKVFLGPIKESELFWNVLFLYSVEQRRAVLRKKADDTGKRTFGDGVYIDDVHYTGLWTPLSLLFYFDFLGWVEYGEINASAYRNE